MRAGVFWVFFVNASRASRTCWDLPSGLNSTRKAFRSGTYGYLDSGGLVSGTYGYLDNGVELGRAGPFFAGASIGFIAFT